LKDKRMKVTITPDKLFGEVSAISSKSFAHRMIIAAALADKETKINLNIFSEDIDASISCIEQLGAKVKKEDNFIVVYPIGRNLEYTVLDCNESGSTARFLLPVAAAILDSFKMVGKGRLPERPFLPLVSQMNKNGVTTDSDKLPMRVCGRLIPGKYEIAGNISSQYITGLLMALPLLDGESEIILTSSLESAAYVDITLYVLSQFGVKIEKTDSGYRVFPSKYISPGDISVEGDWSNAAFWVVADKICGNVKVKGLNYDSLQGDMRILTEVGKDIIDANQIPDLVPVLAVAACAKNGNTKIINAQRLRIKESDRLDAVCRTLTSLGADITQTDDGLIIKGNGRLKGGECDSFNDHRIVMSLAIASCICSDKVIINNAQAVNKSYPTFFDDFKKLGGKIEIE